MSQQDIHSQVQGLSLDPTKPALVTIMSKAPAGVVDKIGEFFKERLPHSLFQQFNVGDSVCVVEIPTAPHLLVIRSNAPWEWFKGFDAALRGIVKDIRGRSLLVQMQREDSIFAVHLPAGGVVVVQSDDMAAEHSERIRQEINKVQPDTAVVFIGKDDVLWRQA